MKGSPSHSNGASPTHWQQNGGKALLSITISDPEKHGSSSSLTNAFVDFKIETWTELPQFCAKEFFVRRRYRDFVWLRQRLCTAFPGAIVPPLPEPDSLLKDDRFSSAFIQRRQAGLQLFLRRVAAHSALARGADQRSTLVRGLVLLVGQGFYIYRGRARGAQIRGHTRRPFLRV